MNGAEALMRTFRGAGVEVCFANPGTTEMALVTALDAVDGIRGVLGLFEGVCSGAADGYEIPRRSTFCGRMMRHSGWFPDRVLRLFRRDKGRFSDDPVHERVILDGKLARLKQPLRLWDNLCQRTCEVRCCQHSYLPPGRYFHC